MEDGVGGVLVAVPHHAGSLLPVLEGILLLQGGQHQRGHQRGQRHPEQEGVRLRCRFSSHLLPSAVARCR